MISTENIIAGLRSLESSIKTVTPNSTPPRQLHFRLKQDNASIQAVINHFREQIMKRKINYLIPIESKIERQESFQAIGEFLSRCTDPDKISFEIFIQLKSIVSESLKQFFTSKVFLLLNPDPNGFISSADLIRFIERSISLEKSLFELLPYCSQNPDILFITSEQIQQYLISFCLPQIDPTHRVDESFYEFYACTAASKFFFYLDSKNTNQINIRSLLHSDVMQELSLLLRLQQQLPERQRRSPDEEEEIERQLQSNWFLPSNVINVYTSFLNLDVDQNGLLSLDEVDAFAGFAADEVQFTRVAWERIFEEVILFPPVELDYRAFVKLTLALDDFNQSTNNGTNDRKSIQGLKYFWNIIDFDRSGVLSPFKIKYFYRDIKRLMERNGLHAPSSDVIVAEIFDMLNFNPTRQPSGEQDLGPTIEQMLQSKQAETAIMILLDVNAFWRYDNRESLMNSPSSSSSSSNKAAEESDTNNKTSNNISSQQPIVITTPTNINVTNSFNNNGGSNKTKFNFASIKYSDEDEDDDTYDFDL